MKMWKFTTGRQADLHSTNQRFKDDCGVVKRDCKFIHIGKAQTVRQWYTVNIKVARSYSSGRTTSCLDMPCLHINRNTWQLDFVCFLSFSE